MVKSIPVEESIFKQKTDLAKLRLEIKKTDLAKTDIHKTVGSWSPETNKLQARFSELKVKERVMEAKLAKSEAFLEKKQSKKPKAKQHKSFSKHLFSKIY